MKSGVAAACVACLLALAAPAFSQSETFMQQPPEDKDAENEAIPIGPFLFSPAVQLEWEARDNIFFAPENEVSDNVYLARARLMLELPIYDNYVRFSYEPKYREFKDYDFPNNWSHDLGVTGAFEFSSGLKLTTGYRFFTGNLETREVDPGGELIFGVEQFDKNYLELVADYWLTPRDGLRVEGNYSDLAYDKRRGEPGYCPPGEVCRFYDYDELVLGIGWLHQLSQTLVMNLEYRHRDFNAAETLAYRDQSSDDLTLGLVGQISPLLSSTLRAGWRQTNLDRPTGAPYVPDYSGPFVNGTLSYELAHGSALHLDLVYTDYPSAFSTNAFYTAIGASLTYSLQRERLFGQARLRLQDNDYDEPDLVTNQSRSDAITTVGLGLGYRVTDLVSVQGGYLYEDRDSLHEYSYTVNTFFLGVVLGYFY